MYATVFSPSNPTTATVPFLCWQQSARYCPWCRYCLPLFSDRKWYLQHHLFFCPIHSPKYQNLYVHVPTSTHNDIRLIGFILYWKQSVVMSRLMPGDTFQLRCYLFGLLVVNSQYVVLTSCNELLSLGMVIHRQDEVIDLNCGKDLFPCLGCELIQVTVCAALF